MRFKEVCSTSTAIYALEWMRRNFPGCPAEWQKPFVTAVTYLVARKWPTVGRPSLRALQLVKSAPCLEEGEVWELPEACLWATGKTLTLAAKEQSKSKV